MLALSACAGAPSSPPGQGSAGAPGAGQDSGAPATPVEPRAPEVPSGQRQAGEDLLRQAERAMASGDDARAQGLLQRAQRLDPSNPAAYLALATLLQKRGEHASARAMAERGLLFCQAQDCDQLRALAAP
ncbi:MAG: tetratricopeptide repeat protein [Halieaceae bacterium]|nr:tetratricopeptide repeat protein [Halieaceae bacterium]